MPSYYGQVGHSTISRSNFDNFGWSLVTVFQILTLENWNDIMVRSMQEHSLWWVQGNGVCRGRFMWCD